MKTYTPKLCNNYLDQSNSFLKLIYVLKKSNEDITYHLKLEKYFTKTSFSNQEYI